MTPTYCLSHNVNYREISGTYVIIDIAADRYYALKDKQAEWFRAVCGGNPAAVSSDSALQFLASMERKGWIRRCDRSESQMSEFLHPPARQSVLDVSTNSQPSLSATDIMRFVRSIHSSRRLSHRGEYGVHQAAKAVARWRRCASLLDRPSEDLDQSTILKFHRLTPFFASTHDECYFRSLALLRFLVLYGIDSLWIFGVRLSPFGAHCWVERDGVVLNDRLENTLQFKPIMSI